MSSVYTGVPGNVTPSASPTATIPSDGDGLAVASVNAALQKSLDYIANLYNNPTAINDFKYNAARTEQFHASALEFVVVSGTPALVTQMDGASDTEVAASTAAALKIALKMRIPPGSVLTGLSLGLRNAFTTPTANGIYLAVKTYSSGGNPAYSQLLAVNNATSPSVTLNNSSWVAITPFTSQTVPTEGWVELEVNLPAGTSQSMFFIGARVTYTTTVLRPAVA